MMHNTAKRYDEFSPPIQIARISTPFPTRCDELTKFFAIFINIISKIKRRVCHALDAITLPPIVQNVQNWRNNSVNINIDKIYRAA